MKKKKFNFVFLFLIIITNLLSAKPTDDEIRKHATELGVPFTELKNLVEKHNVPVDGFSNPRAKNAQNIDFEELEFKFSAKQLIPGTIYRTQCFFDFKSGDRVFIRKYRKVADSTVALKVDKIYDFYQGQPIDILFEYKTNELHAIEIIKRSL